MLTKQPPRRFCGQCKTNLVKPNGKSKHGFTKWHKFCSRCAKSNYNDTAKHLKNKKYICENCGFISIDICQLDLIFLDGDKNNKNSNNLKTYCANCSRLHNKKMKIQKKNILKITVDSDVRI